MDLTDPKDEATDASQATQPQPYADQRQDHEAVHRGTQRFMRYAGAGSVPPAKDVPTNPGAVVARKVYCDSINGQSPFVQRLVGKWLKQKPEWSWKLPERWMAKTAFIVMAISLLWRGLSKRLRDFEAATGDKRAKTKHRYRSACTPAGVIFEYAPTWRQNTCKYRCCPFCHARRAVKVWQQVYTVWDEMHEVWAKKGRVLIHGACNLTVLPKSAIKKGHLRAVKGVLTETRKRLRLRGGCTAIRTAPWVEPEPRGVGWHVEGHLITVADPEMKLPNEAECGAVLKWKKCELDLAELERTFVEALAYPPDLLLMNGEELMTYLRETRDSRTGNPFGLWRE